MDATVIALVGGVVVLVEVVETLVVRFLGDKKETSTNGQSSVVRFDPEVAAIIRETSSRVHRIFDVNEAKDADGAPMVYFPRSLIETQERMVDVLRQIVAQQERLVEAIERIEERQDAMNHQVQQRVMS